MAAAPGAVSAAEAGLSPTGVSKGTGIPERPATPNASAPASIPFFSAEVPDLDDATALLTEVLHGQAVVEGADHGVRFRMVSWQADTARIVLTESVPAEGSPTEGVLTAATGDPRAETPPVGITALAATAGADPGLPAENHIDGWDVTPVLPELGVRLLTKIR